ncbi:MAG: YceI family protein [Bacteroidetes bacterium]|nr:YceI family protein [Bacteroidota bacterium]
MKKTILLFSLALTTTVMFAQKKTTTSATISFDATTDKDALPKAENKSSIASLDLKSGKVAFETSIKNFSFSNPMMQEHFNGEQWMNSEKYATATFEGEVKGMESINFSKDGVYSANVEGNLTMHGETKPVKTTAEFTVKNKVVTATAAFTVKLEDYKVNGGAIAAGKVAKEPKIMVVADFKM